MKTRSWLRGPCGLGKGIEPFAGVTMFRGEPTKGLKGWNPLNWASHKSSSVQISSALGNKKEAPVLESLSATSSSSKSETGIGTPSNRPTARFLLGLPPNSLAPQAEVICKPLPEQHVLSGSDLVSKVECWISSTSTQPQTGPEKRHSHVNLRAPHLSAPSGPPV